MDQRDRVLEKSARDTFLPGPDQVVGAAFFSGSMKDW
jgi:hypothetical protein